MAINETVLEMHFHRPLMELFRETFGLGETGSINFYKYSPQREVFLGFDEAYAKTEMSEDEFFALLRDSASSARYRLPEKFVGYFLQFKVVTVMRNRLRHTPSAMTGKWHYRSSLDTGKNINTGFSQHELLYRLGKNAGAMVYYACPMLFDRSALYEIQVDLDKLQLPDLISCPSEYSDNDQHYIYFNNMTAEPVWCSEPVVGNSLNADSFVSKVLGHAKQSKPSELAKTLLDQLTNLDSLGLTGTEEIFKENASQPSLLKVVGNLLTIVRISEDPEVVQSNSSAAPIIRRRLRPPMGSR